MDKVQKMEEVREEKIYPELRSSGYYSEGHKGSKASAPTELEIMRVKEFKSETLHLQDLLKHYKKVKNRWNKGNTVLKIIGYSLGFTSAILTVILPITLPVLTIAPVILGSISVADGFLTEIVSLSYTSKKKSLYREVCLSIELGISKLFLFQLKALEDGILTDEEIMKSNQIIQDIKNEVIRLKWEGVVANVISNKKTSREKWLKNSYL